MSQINQETANLIAFAQARGLTLTSANLRMAAEQERIIKTYLKNGICLVSPVLANDGKFVLLNDKKGGFNLVNVDAISTVQTTPYADESGNSNMACEDVRAAAMEHLSQDAVFVFLINGVRLDGRIPKPANGDWSLGLALEPVGGDQFGCQVIQWDAVASIQKYDEVVANRSRNRH